MNTYSIVLQYLILSVIVYEKVLSFQKINHDRLRLNSFHKNRVDSISYGTSVSSPYVAEMSSKHKRCFDYLTFSWVNEMMNLYPPNSLFRTRHTFKSRNHLFPKFLGNSGSLQLRNLWRAPKNEMVGYTCKLFNRFFRREISKQNLTIEIENSNLNIIEQYWLSPVTRTIMKMYSKNLLFSGVLRLLNTLLQFSQSFFISKILSIAETQVVQIPPGKNLSGVVYSLLLFIFLSIKSVIENQYFHLSSNIGTSIRGTLSNSIYQKALHLSQSDKTVGEIVNYIQIDTFNLEEVASSVHSLWDGILQITGYTSLLFFFLGPSVIFGILTMAAITPINMYLYQRLSKLSIELSSLTDKRVQTTTEMLQIMTTIKSYSWEKIFSERLADIRARELFILNKASNIRAILNSMWSAAPSFVSVLTLSIYALLGNTLTPSKVFSALSLFNQAQYPVMLLPLYFNSMVEGKNSLDRITKFLQRKEYDNYIEDGRLMVSGVMNSSSRSSGSGASSHNYVDKSKLIDSQILKQSNISIQITDGTFSWMTTSISSNLTNKYNNYSSNGNSFESVNHNLSATPSLTNTTLSIQNGELVAVIGPVGSGKSSLLSALLGNMYKLDGRVEVNGRVAYVPQSAWIPSDSFRNIALFGKPFDSDHYQEAIRVTGLDRDLEQLEDGDATEIGDKGILLSGGQKQRLSIARAVYDDADIYLLDDPLSALDAEVAGTVFTNCIKTALATKTRVLVTHKLSVLPQVDRIIIMAAAVKKDNNEASEVGCCHVLDQGTYSELTARGYDLEKLLEQEEEDGKDTTGSQSEGGDGSFANSEDDTTDSYSPLMIQEYEEEIEGGDAAVVVDDIEDKEYMDEASVDQEGLLSKDITPSATSLASPSSLNFMFKENIHSDKSILEPLEVLASKHEPYTTSATTTIPSTPLVIDKNNLNQVEVLNSQLTSTSTPATSDVSTGTISRSRGVGVSLDVYRMYLRSAQRPLTMLFICALYLASNSCEVVMQLLIGAWTSDIGYKLRPMGVYMSGMALLSAGESIFTWAGTMLIAVFGAAASKAMHNKMVKSVLGAKLHYLQNLAPGRLMLSFSKDLDHIDKDLPENFSDFFYGVVNIIAALSTITFTSPSFSLFALPILAVYINLTSHYRTVAAELRCLDARTRSPIYAHLRETLSGLPIIKSYDKQLYYQRKNEIKLDHGAIATFAMKSLDRWICLRLDMLGNIVVFCTALLAVTFPSSAAGGAGVSLTTALSVTSLLNWTVRNGALTEAYMKSVDRVKQIAEETPQESNSIKDAIKSISTTTTSSTTLHQDADSLPVFSHVDLTSLQLGNNKSSPSSFPLTSLDSIPYISNLNENVQLSKSTTISQTKTPPLPLPDVTWPNKGSITFSNVTLRYEPDSPPVLQGIHFQIQPGECIGIVGRTGSGKSSLFRSLLRLSDITEGTITIDGLDISQLDHHVLRSSVSVILQDPVLFSGSIRLNLDPYGQYSDNYLWEALQKARCAHIIEGLPGGLSYEVAERGDTLSAGQRQLLCLASTSGFVNRAQLLSLNLSSLDDVTSTQTSKYILTSILVKRSKLLLLDEATSSIDISTDKLIRDTIHNEFTQQQCTVLIIAHRLDSIMSCDRVLVMGEGRVVEFDTPKNLLRNPLSHFTKLVIAEKKQYKTESNNNVDKSSLLRNSYSQV